jgi:ribonuclease HepT-like protein
MRERFLVLERSVRADLQVIDRLYAELGAPDLAAADPEKLIVVAYRLHALYTAFENLFRSVALAFENELRERTGWHRELLQRMKLDLTPIRPAVIDEAAYEKLDELLRFRHFFRTAYGVPLDPARLQLAVDKALDLEPLYQPQIERFLQFVQSLD